MMKTTIERLADDKLRLDVEVPDDLLQDAIGQTLELMGRDMRIPGFRPGKVPAQAVLARVGREAAVAEAIRMYMDDWYSSAVMGAGIRPIAAPEIDFPDEGVPPMGEVLRFSATVSVAKRPNLPELSTIEVDKPNVPDLTRYVDQVKEVTLRGAGSLDATTEPAVDGDEVVVDFHCTIGEERVEGAAAIGYQARLGEGRLLGELEAAIIGQTAGSELDVPVDFDADHPMPELAGQHAIFHLNIREVQRLTLPELTDEVARQVSEFDTAEELLADIRASITARLETEVGGIFRANAVNKLAEVADMEEPQLLLERRQSELYNQMKQQLAQNGLTIESYLSGAGKDTTELFVELEQSARDDLRRELSLLALAESLEIQVTEADLRAEIAEHASHTGDDPEASFQQLYQSGRLDMLRGELLIQRTIDHLIEHVTPKAVDLPVADSEAAATSV